MPPSQPCCGPTVCGQTDPEPSLRLTALETMVKEVRTSTSSMTSVPKPLKFLRPHYGTLKANYASAVAGPAKTLLADVSRRCCCLSDFPAAGPPRLPAPILTHPSLGDASLSAHPRPPSPPLTHHPRPALSCSPFCMHGFLPTLRCSPFWR